MENYHQSRPALLLLLALSLLLGSTACKKIEETFPVDEQKMPDATQEGKGTFGCLVEGKLWLPYNPDAGSSPFPADYKIRTNSFPIGASNLLVEVVNRRNGASTTALAIRLGSTKAIAPGVYTLRDGFSASASNSTAAPNAGELYDTANANAGSGTLTITKVEPYVKTVNYITTRGTIVSGTFQFTAATAGGKVLTVTEGRFDLTPFY